MLVIAFIGVQILHSLRAPEKIRNKEFGDGDSEGKIFWHALFLLTEN